MRISTKILSYIIGALINPLHAAVEKSGQRKTSLSHGGREKSTENNLFLRGISLELRIISAHTGPQKIAKEISFQVTKNDMMVAEKV